MILSNFAEFWILILDYILSNMGRPLYSLIDFYEFVCLAYAQCLNRFNGNINRNLKIKAYISPRIKLQKKYNRYAKVRSECDWYPK